MKGSNEKLDHFPCISCGLCCKNITGIDELIEFDAGNGVCKFLDLETNLCKIYESRLLFAGLMKRTKSFILIFRLRSFMPKHRDL
ncbi:YkgJ family cysteine cluster protein [Helicobacter pylori]